MVCLTTVDSLHGAVGRQLGCTEFFGHLASLDSLHEGQGKTSGFRMLAHLGENALATRGGEWPFGSGAAVPAASADRPLLLPLQAWCCVAANRRFGPEA